MGQTRQYLRRALWCSAAAISALTASVCAAAPSVDELAAVLWRYNEVAPNALPIPTASELSVLAEGKTIHLRERLDPAQPESSADDRRARRLRVVGYQVVERPRLLVWLATLHVGTTHEPRLLEHRIRVNDDLSSTWYQHLNTPWPVRNRHWVIRSGKNVALADATGGLAWEHRWALEPKGRDIALNLMLGDTFEQFDQRDFERTIYLDENAGAWTMFALDNDTTLVATHTTTDMGGWIPDRWVAGFVARQLNAVLRKLPEKADTIHERYDPADPVHNGLGQPITLEQISAVRRQLSTSRERAARLDDAAKPRR